KFSMFLTTFLFFIGTLVMIMADTMQALLIGRLIIGFAVGIVSLTVPLYIAEISSASSRGSFVSLNQLAITIGILVSYGVDFSFSASSAWREMFGFSFVPTAILFLGLFFIPETPSWLASHGKKAQAQRVLLKTHKMGKDEEIIVETKKAKSKEIVSWKHLFEKSLRPALLIGVGISIFQQITGINTVIYYAPKIFQMAGFESASSAMLATMGVGSINVIMTIIALWLIDIVGRRSLLIVGLIGMIASLFTLGIAFLLSPEVVGAISVISLMSYVAFFAISLGPVAWLIISEIYPMGIRGRAMGFASFANWTCNYIVSLTFLSLINLLGKTGAFWFYGVIGVLALWFVYKLVPETKGKTFEQIQKLLKK
ncbi:MAG: sugar porter family MFS transporter, partial [Chlamydiae bacterium]|nr:sugar porter family MFS transporter [Chlamydiota bacterium]